MVFLEKPEEKIIVLKRNSGFWYLVSILCCLVTIIHKILNEKEIEKMTRGINHLTIIIIKIFVISLL